MPQFTVSFECGCAKTCNCTVKQLSQIRVFWNSETKAWGACRSEMDPILARLKKAEAAAYVSIEAAKGWE